MGHFLGPAPFPRRGLSDKGFFGTLHRPTSPPPVTSPLFAVVASDDSNPYLGGQPFIATRTATNSTWTVENISAFAANGLYSVGKAAGVWLVGSNNGNAPSEIGISTDGHTYTIVPVNPNNGANLQSIGGTSVLALIGGGLPANNLMSSNDGNTWANTNSFLGGSALVLSIAAGGGHFACCGVTSGNNFGFSADGLTWSASSYGSHGGTSVIWDGTQFVAIAQSLSSVMVAAVSADAGDNYIEIVLTNLPDAKAITYNGQVYVVIGQTAVLVSATLAGLLTATAVPVLAIGRFTAIASDPSTGLIIAASNLNLVYSSPDNGVTWTPEDTGASTLHLTNIAFG